MIIEWSLKWVTILNAETFSPSANKSLLKKDATIKLNNKTKAAAAVTSAILGTNGTIASENRNRTMLK